MPELPEVETVTKILKPIIANQTIKKIDVLRKETIVGDSNEFVKGLTGETFLDVTRIGKYLIFHLTNDKVIISHLRMEGKYYKYNENEKNSFYSRVVYHFENGEKLCYDDSRCFGILVYSNEKEYKNFKEIAKLGPEPFYIDDVSFLLEACKNKKLPIKATLLDQSLIAGLGNIYVDETLFASKIHPLTPANKITKTEWETIIKNAKEILTNAIELGGSTIKSYHPGKDIDGKFQNNIKVYGKAGENCPTCGSTLRFIKVGGRGTSYCPKCQIKKGAPLHVAVTGKIASGKSAVLTRFKAHNIPTFSSDSFVKELYERDTVVKQIESLLKISFPNHKMDKAYLRNYLVLNPQDKKKLEKLIHPMVIKEIETFLAKKDPIKLVEVPLLFESGLDEYFDTIITMDINPDIQYERLAKRDPKKAMLLKEINKTNKIDKNIGKSTFVLENNSSLEELNKNINSIICKLEALLN